MDLHVTRRVALGAGFLLVPRCHKGGKQKKLYLGKTDHPEDELQRRRGRGDPFDQTGRATA